MKNQLFFTKFKKILSYPFNWEFITLQKQTIKLLDKKRDEYYSLTREKDLDKVEWAAFQKNIDLRNKINQCWDLNDVSTLLYVEISKVLKGHIIMKIFDNKTKWFLWKNIFLRVDAITVEYTKAAVKNQLNVLKEISTTFNLGK